MIQHIRDWTQGLPQPIRSVGEILADCLGVLLVFAGIGLFEVGFDWLWVRGLWVVGAIWTYSFIFVAYILPVLLLVLGVSLGIGKPLWFALKGVGKRLARFF